ncbi:Arylsulfatase B [Hypsibius exemplaris]|uniref:Arylsulfatase B n=1 Tax=Hypsibius exemplaris TaxID=2072580 RepID=A0A9X6RLP7_HYPEX|nr:Arylsulfatase B [Hypsibius exemplaris]
MDFQRPLILSQAFVFLLISDAVFGSNAKPPNIVFILADDLGHNDIGYAEGSHQVPTPHIDALAYDGVILNRHYSFSACTPSRASLMTGRYTFQMGIQSAIVINPGQPWGIPLNYKLMPAFLKELNYTTQFYGKWHIGSHTRAYHPCSRGFDNCLYYNSNDVSLFDYSAGWIAPVANRSGRDLYENGFQVPMNCTNNHYLPDLLTEKFEQFLHTHDGSKPFYVQMNTPLPKSASEWDGTTRQSATMYTMPEFQLRPAVANFSDKFPGRKKEMAMIQALDDQVNRIITALKNKGALDNTIVVFVSDNGAQSLISDPTRTNYGSNAPLRMFKRTLFEGGVRTLAFINSPLLKRRGVMTNQLFHISDWLPTLYEAAGGDLAHLGDISGLSHWKSLVNGETSGPRNELVINIDLVANQYALIKEYPYNVLYKMIGGNVFNNSYTGWERTIGTSAADEMRTPTPASIVCNTPGNVAPSAVNLCEPWIADCLFDLTNDPCETTNLAAKLPDILEDFQSQVAAYMLSVLPYNLSDYIYDDRSNPALHWNGWWVPWLDPVPVLQSPACAPFNPTSAS